MITLKNIQEYIQGNVNNFLNDFNLLPKYKQEQVQYRLSQCPPACKTNGKCVHCGCSYPAKTMVSVSCNKSKKLPNLMNEADWNQYKQTNNIEGT